ncbi:MULTISPECIES: ScbA/BarX family gamma-butyrolactone biosynthesis protein [unclassified Streptomyces]|uniref:ScbA/BarX family gamma-butyrolactone biosynthesis protein n=1 Tax=unclassified Streptomyces TaxID=2593676 RepID=UPI00131A4148|nr:MULTISPECIES: ScbA/BarX family gamma-butyrolactone biosynthesis protein [unclassified Streptomyces]MYT27412.1 A-factor biosynthesis protein [Streptomyces sp. SID8354]
MSRPLLRLDHKERSVAPHESSPLPATQSIERSASVLKSFVHLRRDDSVLVTDWQRSSAMNYQVTARWPARGNEVPGRDFRSGTMTVAQTVRQAGLLLAHTEFGVPLSHAVLLRNFDFDFDMDFLGGENKPADLIINVRCEITKSRGRSITGLQMTMSIHFDGRQVGTAATSFEWIPPAVFRRLRGDHAEAVSDQPPLSAPVAPAQVDCTTDVEVVLTPTDDAGRWLLRSDFQNTALYDHPVDHVPGLVLIEAAQQAARLAASPRTFRAETVKTAFHRYVEFDSPCSIEAHPVSAETEGATAVSVTGRQNGELAFTAVLTSSSC